MPQKDLQAQRIAAEAAHQPRSPARVIDAHYRLQPNDLAGNQARVVVRSVTTQGIEKIVPVIHFEGLAKPLVLDADNVAAMAHITGSPMAADWPGATLLLRVVPEQDIPHIRLYAPDASLPAPVEVAAPALPMPSARNLRTALLFLLVLAVALTAVYLIENAPVILPDFLRP